MNYQQTLDYMFSRLPMFQRIGSAAYKADLNNTIALCSLLHNPERNFKTIHVAGTNGKGSTSHMLASILQCAGYKTGLYTSPHLTDFRERIKINGIKIPEEFVTSFIENYIQSDVEKPELSFFEMTVGMAFNYFANENVDIAIIEVGLGGRLDSTNVIRPELSIITNISFDHKALLGDTLEAIAGEKAGIIKENIPVIIGEKQEETKHVFIKQATDKNAPLLFADDVYKAGNTRHIQNGKLTLQTDIIRKGNVVMRDLECELPGFYQQKNIPAVLCAIDILKKLDYFITDTNVRTGIKKVMTNTGLSGRWQILCSNPLTIADTGHNEAGIKEVVAQLGQTPHKQLHFVLGMVNDKDISAILALLPKDATYYFCKANIPRALDADQLSAQAKEHNLNGNIYSSVKDALTSAQEKAGKDDLIFIGGSTFTVAEVV
jgi:dihydrofolate synthase / folylpolyglutamate synthase